MWNFIRLFAVVLFCFFVAAVLLRWFAHRWCIKSVDLDSLRSTTEKDTPDVPLTQGGEDDFDDWGDADL